MHQHPKGWIWLLIWLGGHAYLYYLSVLYPGGISRRGSGLPGQSRPGKLVETPLMREGFLGPGLFNDLDDLGKVLPRGSLLARVETSALVPGRGLLLVGLGSRSSVFQHRGPWIPLRGPCSNGLEAQHLPPKRSGCQFAGTTGSPMRMRLV